MMYFGDREGGSLNTFIFISLIIHAILFITFPQWGSFLISDSYGLEEGGIIQVIYSESTSREYSPVVDPTSQTSHPQVEQPRPNEEPPSEQAGAVTTESESDETVPPAEPRLEWESIPEPQTPIVDQSRPDLAEDTVDDTEPESIDSEEPDPESTDSDPESTDSQLITSDSGEELHIDTPEPETEIEPEPEIENGEEQESELEVDSDEIGGESGSGDSLVGDSTDGSGIDESGFGEAEIAPPPPPPLPSGRALIAGVGHFSYPKDPQNESIEGIVTLDVTVSTDGEIRSVEVVNSSGDDRLDRHARLTIENLWNIEGKELDYILTISVGFSLERGVAILDNPEDISVRWVED